VEYPLPFRTNSRFLRAAGCCRIGDGRAIKSPRCLTFELKNNHVVFVPPQSRSALIETVSTKICLHRNFKPLFEYSAQPQYWLMQGFDRVYYEDGTIA
jgi:hypothetical protein